MPLPPQTEYRDFLAVLRRIGFQGPYQRGKHPFLRRGSHTLHIPNPHEFPILSGKLRRILRNGGVLEEYEAAIDT